MTTLYTVYFAENLSQDTEEEVLANEVLPLERVGFFSRDLQAGSEMVFQFCVQF